MKQIISSALAMIILISCFSISVNASSTTIGSESNFGALEATAEQMEYWSSRQKSSRYDTNRAIDSTKAGWIWPTGMVVFYEYYGQEKNYTCGPACVKMALKIITNQVYNEDVISSGCNTTTSGTYLSDMVTYINSVQTYNEYVPHYRATKDFMAFCLTDCVRYWDSPPIIGIRETISENWLYNLGGHFVIITAAMSDETAYEVTDPWSGFVGDTENCTYVKSADELYNAYNLVNIGFMY